MKLLDQAVPAIWILSGALVFWSLADIGDSSEESSPPAAVVPAAGAISGAALPDVRFRFLKDETQPPFALRQPDGRRSRLLVVFTEADCYTRFADVSFWAALNETFDAELDVLAVTSGPSPRVLQYFVEQQGLRLPVFYDSTAVIASLLARADLITPALVLASANGTVLRADPATHGDPASQAEYIRTLQTFLDGNHPSSRQQ